MIRIPSHLQRNSFGVYHFRIAVPLPLRPYFTKSEIKRSLRTKDPHQALRVARVVAIHLEQIFSKLKEFDMARRNNKIDPTQVPKVQVIDIRTDGSIRIEGLELDPNNPEQDLKLFEGALAAAKRFHAPMAEVPPPEYRLEALTMEFSEEKARESSWNLKTRHENIAIFHLLIRIVGNVPIHTIGYEQARDYKRIIQRLPPNLNKNPLYRSKTIEDVLAMKPAETMAINTLNKNLNRVSSFFTWAKKHGYVKENYFEGLGLRNPKQPHEQRIPFSDDDVESIFRLDIFTKRKFRHPYYYWVPQIGLYTGARLEEICQLHVADIREVDGIWVFDFNDAEEKRLKTLASRRLVPIHMRLIGRGLFDHVKRLQKAQEERLFPELSQQRDGYSQAVSKWFSRLLIRFDLKDEGKSFHSFRHTVADQLKQKGVPREKIAAILGHQDESITTGRYGKEYQPRVLKEVIDLLEFPVYL